MSIPISTGSGVASVAAEAVGGLQYQQVVLVSSGGSIPASVISDGSLKANVAKRNDTLASITGADNSNSAIAVDPSGAVTVHDAPITKWVQGTADLRGSQGASVTAITAQGASIFTYIREVQVANMGSASVLVTIGGGLGSILGYTIAPAGGGSNYTTRLKTGENSAVTASISGTASVLVSLQGFISKI